MLSRLKGIETGVRFMLMFTYSLASPKVLSCLKEIETSASKIAVDVLLLSCLRGLSRLKGIETFASLRVMLVQGNESESAFPFEGN